MSQEKELSDLMVGLKIEEKTSEGISVPWYDETKNLPNIVKCQAVVREWLVKKYQKSECTNTSLTFQLTMLKEGHSIIEEVVSNKEMVKKRWEQNLKGKKFQKTLDQRQLHHN